MPTDSADPIGETTCPASPTQGTGPDVARSQRYQLHEVIARGGMGDVYRATDVVLSREVAVKVLQDRNGSGSAAARRFAEEARITGQLQHPNIPAVHDLGTLPDGRPFLAMKLIKGQTLDALLKLRQTPEDERWRFVAAFEQICHAVGYAHAHEVIHRDLKPANVMVGAHGEVQVMDWGLAKVLTPRPGDPDHDADATAGTVISSPRDSDSATRAGTVLGTLAFMPPEQALGAVGKVDRRSDVFGLGAILAVILTGQPPFQGGSGETLRLRAAAGRLDDCFKRLDDCGAEPELIALCKRCLSPDPADRPADASEVAMTVAEFRSAVDERARQAELQRVRAEGERTRVEARAEEQRKRRRVQLALAAAVLLLILGAGAFAWWQSEQGRAERERQGRNAEAVAALLGQCEDALRGDDTPKAEAALAAAEKRWNEGGTEPLSDRLERCQQDLALLREFDAADDFRWTPNPLELPGLAQAAERLTRVLRKADLDPRTAGEQAAAAIADSPLRQRVLAALDRVLLTSKSKEVRATLRAIDPHTYRDAVRDAVLAADAEALAGLASRPAAADQPPGFVAVLGDNPAVPLASRRDLLTAAVRRRPGSLGLLMALGGTYPVNQREGAEQRARWYQAAVEVAPRKASAYRCLGAALQEGKDFLGAVAACSKAVELEPNYAHARHALGNALSANNDPEGAIASYKKAIELNPRFAYAYMNIGLVVQREGDTDEAIVWYQKAIGIDPTIAYAHGFLGDARKAKNDRDGALAAYTKAAELDPGSAARHHALGYARLAKNDIDGAVTAQRKALELDPKYAWAHVGLGDALRLKLEYDGAIASYRKAIELDPTITWAHRYLGLALQARSDPDGAIASYKKALELDPGSADLHKHLGDALRNRRDLDGAIAAYTKALELDPRSIPAHNSLGFARAETNDVDSAIAAHRKALEIDPDHAFTHAALGRALQKKGDLDGAVAAYKEALRLDPKQGHATTFLPEAERGQRLLPRLPDVLAGKAEPGTPAEVCEYASLCGQRFQGRYVDAVRLYRAAFAAEAKLAAEHCYAAARCACLAAAGKDRSLATFGPEEWGHLTDLAHGWLRDDLDATVEKARDADRAGFMRSHMKICKQDADFAAVRDREWLAKMPGSDRRRWQAFWADEDEFLSTPTPVQNMPNR